MNWLISYPIVTKVQNYSKQYLRRALVLTVIGFLLWLVSGRILEAIILAIAIEVYVVDFYTDKLMPPAFMFQTRRLIEMDCFAPEKNLLFLWINGTCILFILFVMIWLS